MIVILNKWKFQSKKQQAQENQMGICKMGNMEVKNWKK
jgi:hypothetical protein